MGSNCQNLNLTTVQVLVLLHALPPVAVYQDNKLKRGYFFLDHLNLFSIMIILFFWNNKMLSSDFEKKEYKLSRRSVMEAKAGG